MNVMNVYFPFQFCTCIQQRQVCYVGIMVVAIFLFITEYVRLTNIMVYNLWQTELHNYSQPPPLPLYERVPRENRVFYSMDGTRFIIEDRANNCSRIPWFDPYSVNGPDMHRFMPSLPSTSKPCLQVKFSTSPKMPRTALASHPGSGNTWTRHLIQQLTGNRHFDSCIYFR